MKPTQNTINDFIINTSVIEPIEKIISDLENGNFRDCDIDYLNKKLHTFTQIAAKTLGINFEYQEIVNNDNNLNPYKKDRFLTNFKKLLDYFKTF